MRYNSTGPLVPILLLVFSFILTTSVRLTIYCGVLYHEIKMKGKKEILHCSKMLNKLEQVSSCSSGPKLPISVQWGPLGSAGTYGYFIQWLEYTVKEFVHLYSKSFTSETASALDNWLKPPASACCVQPYPLSTMFTSVALTKCWGTSTSSKLR